MKRSEKKDFVKKLKKDFLNTSSVVVAHYSGLTVLETDEIRKAMREKGAKFKITKNSLTKLALANTKLECINDLFNGPTAIAFSDDSIIAAKASFDFGKTHKNFKILGGFFEGEKIDSEKVKYLASLPTLDEVRGKLIGLISRPAQKIVYVLNAPASQIVTLLSKYSPETSKV